MRTMNSKATWRGLLVCLAASAIAASAYGQFEIRWSTVDSGGEMFTAGGDFELSGTIAQPDAGSAAAPLAGGNFELLGGFWVRLPGASGCGGGKSCAACGYFCGDTDCNGALDAFDISAFILALTNVSAFNVAFPGCDPICVADTNGNKAIDSFDIAGFIDAITTGDCPNPNP